MQHPELYMVLLKGLLYNPKATKIIGFSITVPNWLSGIYPSGKNTLFIIHHKDLNMEEKVHQAPTRHKYARK